MRVSLLHELWPQLHFDTGKITNLTSPYMNTQSPSHGNNTSSPGGGSKTNAFSPAVVAVIGVLAGAFLIVSYYRIFAKYCNRIRLPYWGTRVNDRDDGPSAIVLMEEQIWPPNAMGLDESLINRIPTCTFKHQEGLIEGTECSVCLSEFEEGEVLRVLPKCNHPFHIQCIDTWLQSHSTCPLCRVNIVLAAGLPFALMPLERESPLHGSFRALVPASTPMQALINHEIEMLQEQYLQELLEGQLSGPSNSVSRPSSRCSYVTAQDVETRDHQPAEFQEIRQEFVQHGRHMSLEMNMSPTRLISVINSPQMSIREIPELTIQSSISTRRRPYNRDQRERLRHLSLEMDMNPRRGISVIDSPQMSIREIPRLASQSSFSTKRRVYSRAQSERHRHSKGVDRGRGMAQRSDQKGKHPLIPLSSPRMKRFARFARSNSAASSSSSSLNHVVVELLAQEIFKETAVKMPGASSSSILETSVRKVGKADCSKESTSGGSSTRFLHMGPDNMLYLGDLNRSGENRSPLTEDIFSESTHFRGEGDEMVINVEDLERTLWQLDLSQDEDENNYSRRCRDLSSRFSKTFKGSSMRHPSFCHTWPQKSLSFKKSMSKLRRYGSTGARSALYSFRGIEKVHASEPVFEIFDFS